MGYRCAIALVCIALAACAGSARPVSEPSDDRDRIPFSSVGTAEQAKLSPLFVQKWRAAHFQAGGNTPVIVRGRSPIGDGERADLERLGAEHVRAVTTSPGDQGAVHARATRDPSDAVIAHVPDEQLIALAGLPWVTRLDIANSYPAGPELTEAVERRLDPGLRGALAKLRRDRPSQVGGLGKTSGCLDDDRRKILVALGATISTVVSARDCADSIFTFTIGTERLIELASIPWIVMLETGHRMYPDKVHDPSE